MLFVNHKKSHAIALVAAAFVHSIIAILLLAPSSPAIANQQIIRISFVAPSAFDNKNNKTSTKKIVNNSEIALKQKKNEIQKSDSEENTIANKETFGQVDKTSTATNAVESDPIFNVKYLNNPTPKYPSSARRKGIQGKVLLWVVVKADGLPASVEVSDSSGSTDLDRAALEAVKQWKFIPAKSKQQFVQASVIVPIEFKII